MAELVELIENARSHIDLTDATHRSSVTALADAMVALDPADGEEAVRAEAPLEARIAGLLARSRRWMLGNPESVAVGVVFAMWGEQNRLRPRTASNPNGEDSLVTKLEQLAWVTEGTPVSWHLYAVDDGCPSDSARIARDIAASHPLGKKATIVSLADHLPAESGPLRELASAEDSRKGGAIILGAMKAREDGVEAVVYTDADNSVHLGQLGLLLRPFVEKGSPVVLGDRKHSASVLVKEGARWGIGIKVLRHMQRMAGEAIFSRGILDTQAAFKLYESGLLAEIIAEPTVFDFSFDTDWILAALGREVPIELAPFAFIDSAAESASITQGPMTTWKTLLCGLVRAVRRRGFCTGPAAEMADLIEREVQSHHDLELVIDRLPPELEEAPESALGDPDLLSPARLDQWWGAIRAGAKSKGNGKQH